jgi:fluoride exporter
MRIILLIGAGGFIGTIARYLLQQVVSKMMPVIFPFGTLAVNLIGCFLIGILYAMSERWNILTPEWRLFLTTGFCGGFTTFSTFTYEAYGLLREDQYLYVSLYIGISVLAGLAATFLAIHLIRSL